MDLKRKFHTSSGQLFVIRVRYFFCILNQNRIIETKTFPSFPTTIVLCWMYTFRWWKNQEDASTKAIKNKDIKYFPVSSIRQHDYLAHFRSDSWARVCLTAEDININIHQRKSKTSSEQEWGKPFARQQAKAVYFKATRVLELFPTSIDTKSMVPKQIGPEHLIAHIYCPARTVILSENKTLEDRAKALGKCPHMSDVSSKVGFISFGVPWKITECPGAAASTPTDSWSRRNHTPTKSVRNIARQESAKLKQNIIKNIFDSYI